MVRLPSFKSGRWRLGYISAIITCLATGIILVAATGNSQPTSQPAPTKPQATSTVPQAAPAKPSQDNGGQSSMATAPASSVPSSTSVSTQSVTAPSSVSVSPAPATASQVTATLMVNSSVQGMVKLPAGSNQCDLLSQAFAKGVISQLTMKYDSRYNSHGVYQINGQGDANIVWWVYEVNSKSPPYGCDGVMVHDGDTVNWKYIRS